MKNSGTRFLAVALILSLMLVLAGCSSSAAKAAEPTPAPTPEPTEEPTPTPKALMDTADLAEYVQRRTVTVTVKTITDGSSVGSGFFIDDEGTVVTNFHVIDMAAEISVELDGGGSYPVREIVDFNNIYDLAVLKIDVQDTPYLERVEKEVRTGEQVYAVGSALGELKGTFTGGMVSSVRRSYGKIECIQMDAAISSGNSGGPLVNGYGEVVGINTASYTRGENLNLAIKISELDRLSMDKHFSVNRFKEWYEQEASRSWSPTDGESYYYSLVNNYQTVTGATCLYSKDNGENGDKVSGYQDCYDSYTYEYNTAEYDQYVEYLRNVGFEYEGSESQSTWVGTSYYYYNEKEGISLDLFVLKDFTQITIWPEI